MDKSIFVHKGPYAAMRQRDPDHRRTLVRCAYAHARFIARHELESGMETRTIEEYKAILKRGLDESGALRPEVQKWGRSACIVLRAALVWSAGEGARTKAQALELREEVPSHKGKRRKRAPAPDAAMVSAYRVQAESLEDSAEKSLSLLPYYMGFRASELLNITRSRVEAALKHGEITFVRKGGKTATLPLNDTTKSLFQPLIDSKLEWKTIGNLLSRSDLKKSQLTAYERLISKVGELVKKNEDEGAYFDWHPHSLRHAFAQRMRKNGAPLKVIQAWLAHENIATTDIYLGAADPNEGLEYLPD